MSFHIIIYHSFNPTVQFLYHNCWISGFPAAPTSLQIGCEHPTQRIRCTRVVSLFPATNSSSHPSLWPNDIQMYQWSLSLPFPCVTPPRPPVMSLVHRYPLPYLVLTSRFIFVNWYLLHYPPDDICLSRICEYNEICLPESPMYSFLPVHLMKE